MARAMAVPIRWFSAAALLAGLVWGYVYLEGLTTGGLLTEPRNFNYLEQYVLSNEYIDRALSAGTATAYEYIERESVRLIVKPFTEAMAWASLAALVLSLLWFLIALFLAKPRQPAEVEKSRGVWALVLGLTIIGALVPVFILLEPAVVMIMPPVGWVTVSLVAVFAALLYVAWTYLITPSLLRPALPLAWRLGR